MMILSCLLYRLAALRFFWSETRALGVHFSPLFGVWTFLCPRIGIWTFTVSTFRGTFYAISLYFGRNLALWTISCYRPKQGAFHDKSLISTPKNGYEETKKGRGAGTAIWQHDAGRSISCTHSPYLVVIACILTVYQPTNAKRSPHALYQSMRT